MTISMLSPAQHVEARGSTRARSATVGRPRGGIELAVCDAAGRPAEAGEMSEFRVPAPWPCAAAAGRSRSRRRCVPRRLVPARGTSAGSTPTAISSSRPVKDAVISGGANIYPREVEASRDARRRSATLQSSASPTGYWGEAVVAVVVPSRPGTVDEEARSKRSVATTSRRTRSRAGSSSSTRSPELLRQGAKARPCEDLRVAIRTTLRSLSRFSNRVQVSGKPDHTARGGCALLLRLPGVYREVSREVTREPEGDRSLVP